MIQKPPTRSAARALAVTALLLISADSTATGFFVNQQSVRGIGRVDAGNSAIASDVSTVFFNPAGLVRLFDGESRIRSKLSIGVNTIIPKSDLKNLGSSAATPGTLGASVPYAGATARDPGKPTPIAHAYYARPIGGNRLIAGIGLTAPFGLGVKYDTNFFGRYDALKGELRTINFGPVLAYRLNDHFSLGGGIDLQYARTSLASALPNTLAPGGPSPATDGHFGVVGDDWSAGYNVGVLAQLSSRTRIGAHYRSAVTHEIRGNSSVSGLSGPLATLNGATGASAKLKLPDIVAIGIAHELQGGTTLLGEFQWYGWARLSQIRIEFDNGAPAAIRPFDYRNTYAVSVGFEHPINSRFDIRGGVKYGRTPTVDSSRDVLFPDGNRLWFAAGMSYQIDPDMGLDFAVVHAVLSDAPVDIKRTFYAGTPAAGSIRIRGEAQTTVTTIGVNLRLRF